MTSIMGTSKPCGTKSSKNYHERAGGPSQNRVSGGRTACSSPAAQPEPAASSPDIRQGGSAAKPASFQQKKSVRVTAHAFSDSFATTIQSSWCDRPSSLSW
ncbi:MAG TPA: hypothetical protein VGF36_09065, partial [Rhodopila sp.]